MDSLETLFKASKIIEEDGIDGIKTATELVGKDIALGMLICKLRRDLGSTKTFPAKPEIDAEVKVILAENNLI